MASVPYSFNYSNTTAVERQPVNSVDVWQDIAAIPANPATASGIVVSVSGALFTSISGNVYRYACPQFSTMVPGNYWGGAYQPTLKDSSGVNIPYNPTVWVADSTLKVIEFQSAAPKSLGYNPPFYLNYWQYTASGGIGPGGQIAATPSGNSLLATNVSSPQTLVSLLAGNNVSMELTNVTGGQLLTVDANLSSLGAPTVSGKSLIQLVPSATSAYGSPQESKLVSIAAGYGMNITSSIDAVTGGAYLTFNSAGISGETIVFVNDGAGTPNSAGVYESTTGFTTYLRSIVGGAGIGVSQGSSLIEIDNTTTGQSIGGGIPVYASSASGVLIFDTLAVGPSNNLTIGAAAGLITVDTATNQSIAGTLRVAGRSYLDGTAVGSLTISGAAIAPTAAAGDNSTTIATTAFVANSISGYLGPTHGQNINPSGVPVYVSTVLDTLNFNTLLAGPSNNLTISAASGLVTLDLVQNPVIAGKLGVVGATSLGSLSVSGASVMSGAVQAASMTVIGSEIVGGPFSAVGAASLGSLSVSGTSVMSGAVQAASMTVIGSEIVGGPFSAVGAASLGSLTVSGASVMSGAVQAASMTVIGSEIVGGPFSAIGAASLGSLSVSGASVLAGAVQAASMTVIGSEIVGGPFSAIGAASLGSLSVSGTSVLSGAVQAASMTVLGNEIVNGTLTVSGASTLAGLTAGASQVASLTVTGASNVPTATAGDSSNTIASTAFVANSISGFTGSGQGHNINPSGVPVYVNTSSGALNFNTLLAGPSNNLSITASGGLVTIDLVQNPVISQLSVIGASSLGSLSVSGASTLAGVTAGAVQVTGMANSGNSSVGGTLSVSGQATLAGVSAGAVQVTSLANSGNSSVGGTLSVSGASTLAGVSAGAVQVTGMANSGNSSVGGTLTVSGDTTFYGQATGLTVPLADISTHLATTQYVSNYVAATISGSSISGGIIVGNTTFADNVLFLKNITVSGSSSLQGVSIGGALTANGSAGTAGQVLTASGSGAPYWGTALVGSTNSAYATTALGYNASAGSGIYNTAIGFGATVPSGTNHGIYLGTSTETIAIQGGLNLHVVNVPSQLAFPLYLGQGGSTIAQVYFISSAGAAHLPSASLFVGASVAFRAANGTTLSGFTLTADDNANLIYQLSGTASQNYIPGSVQLCSFVSDGSNWYQMQ